MCYVCGNATSVGHREAPSDVFTAWADIYSGDVLCEWCHGALHHRPHRMFSWMASLAGVRFQTKDDRGWLLDALLSPPDFPCAFYLTRGGQKQAWITLHRYVTHSQNTMWVGTDWTSRPVLINRAWIDWNLPLLRRVRGVGLSKQKLLSGQFTMKDLERAMLGGWMEDIDSCRRLVGNPKWEVLVYVV